MSLNITLESGRKIALVELRQRGTYYGHLAGLSRKTSNDSDIERALDVAEKLGPTGCKPYLIPQKIISHQRTSQGRSITEERLPAIACIAVFDSTELFRTGSEPYSSAGLVWYQDDFALPIAEHVLAKIKEIDWESVAVDWIGSSSMEAM